MYKEVELKDCPFCGGGTMFVRGVSKLVQVYCGNCGATTSFQGKERMEKEMTAAMYNRRAGK